MARGEPTIDDTMASQEVVEVIRAASPRQELDLALLEKRSPPQHPVARGASEKAPSSSSTPPPKMMMMEDQKDEKKEEYEQEKASTRLIEPSFSKPGAVPAHGAPVPRTAKTSMAGPQRPIPSHAPKTPLRSTGGVVVSEEKGAPLVQAVADTTLLPAAAASASAFQVPTKATQQDEKNARDEDLDDDDDDNYNDDEEEEEEEEETLEDDEDDDDEEEEEQDDDDDDKEEEEEGQEALWVEEEVTTSQSPSRWPFTPRGRNKQPPPPKKNCHVFLLPQEPKKPTPLETVQIGTLPADQAALGAQYREIMAKIQTARQLLDQALAAPTPSAPRESRDVLAKAAFMQATEARQMAESPTNNTDLPAELQAVLVDAKTKGEAEVAQLMRLYETAAAAAPTAAEGPSSAAGPASSESMEEHISRAKHFLDFILPELTEEAQALAQAQPIPANGPLTLDDISTLGFDNTFDQGSKPTPKTARDNADVLSMSSLNEILDGPLDESPVKLSTLPRTAAVVAPIPATTVPAHQGRGGRWGQSLRTGKTAVATSPKAATKPPRRRGFFVVRFLGVGGSSKKTTTTTTQVVTQKKKKGAAKSVASTVATPSMLPEKQVNQVDPPAEEAERFAPAILMENDERPVEGEEEELEPEQKAKLDRIKEIDERLQEKLLKALASDDANSMTSVGGVPLHGKDATELNNKKKKNKKKKASEKKKAASQPLEAEVPTKGVPLDFSAVKPTFLPALVEESRTLIKEAKDLAGADGPDDKVVVSPSETSVSLNTMGNIQRQVDVFPTDDGDQVTSWASPDSSMFDSQGDRYTVVSGQCTSIDRYTIMNEDCSYEAFWNTCTPSNLALLAGPSSMSTLSGLESATLASPGRENELEMDKYLLQEQVEVRPDGTVSGDPEIPGVRTPASLAPSVNKNPSEKISQKDTMAALVTAKKHGYLMSLFGTRRSSKGQVKANKSQPRLSSVAENKPKSSPATTTMETQPTTTMSLLTSDPSTMNPSDATASVAWTADASTLIAGTEASLTDAHTTEASLLSQLICSGPALVQNASHAERVAQSISNAPSPNESHSSVPPTNSAVSLPGEPSIGKATSTDRVEFSNKAPLLDLTASQAASSVEQVMSKACLAEQSKSNEVLPSNPSISKTASVNSSILKTLSVEPPTTSAPSREQSASSVNLATAEQPMVKAPSNDQSIATTASASQSIGKSSSGSQSILKMFRQPLLKGTSMSLPVSKDSAVGGSRSREENGAANDLPMKELSSAEGTEAKSLSAAPSKDVQKADRLPEPTDPLVLSILEHAHRHERRGVDPITQADMESGEPPRGIDP